MSAIIKSEKIRLDIGKRIQTARLKAGYKQEDLANFLNVTTQSVSNIESGKHLPKLIHLIELCEFLHVSCDFIIWGQENSNEPIPDIIDQYYRLPAEDKKSLERVIFEFLKIRSR